MVEFGEIPYSKIIWLAERLKVKDIECFEYLIRALDSAFLDVTTNKLKSNK